MKRHRLRRVLQRMSLTKYEAIALIALSSLFSIGILARHIQQGMVSVPADAYDEIDRLFFERVARDSVDRLVRDSVDRLAVAEVPDSASAAQGGAAGESKTASTSGMRDASLRVDVNTASLDELQDLPRIGPATAERIVAFRSVYGPFRSVDDLQQVRGIGPRTVEVLRPHVVLGVEDASAP